MIFSDVLKISRPRFWLYIVGPFIVGSSFATRNLADITTFTFLYSFFYFLIPGNIFLYGVNDFFDMYVDSKNPKKNTKEKRMKSTEKKYYSFLIIVSFLLSIPMLSLMNPVSKILFVFFLFFSFFYSAPPIRFKTKPMLDFSSNILYALPGFIGYSLFTDSFPNFWIVLAAYCWTSAMHLFSATVDIESDRKAGIQTSATLLRKNYSLLLCSFLWFMTTLIAVSFRGLYSLSLLYFFIPLLIVFKKIEIEKMYWLFPYINATLGFIFFVSSFL